MTSNINLSGLDHMVETFPIGSLVDNTIPGGTIRSLVVAYHWTPTLGYTGEPILMSVEHPECGKWVANPDLCKKAT